MEENNFEFPQSVLEVNTITTVCLEYPDGKVFKNLLKSPENFANETVPNDKPIAVFTAFEENGYFCGVLDKVSEGDGELFVKIRSIVSRSCVIEIPLSHIKGWVLLPGKV